MHRKQPSSDTHRTKINRMFKRNSPDFSSPRFPLINEDGYPPDLSNYSSLSSSSAAVSHSTTPQSGWTEAKRPRSSLGDSSSSAAVSHSTTPQSGWTEAKRRRSFGVSSDSSINHCIEFSHAINADNGRLFSPVPLVATTPVGAARSVPRNLHQEPLESAQTPHGWIASASMAHQESVSSAAPRQMVIDTSQRSFGRDDSRLEIEQAKASPRIKGERSVKQWRKDEDGRLLQAVLQWGTHERWDVIATYVLTRNSKQCRERYQNYLCPDISNESWTMEETRELITLRFKIKQNLVANMPNDEQGRSLGTPNGKRRSAKQVQNYFDTHIKEHMSVIMQQRVNGVLSISNDQAVDRVLEAMRNAKAKKESPRESSKRAQAIRQSAEKAAQEGRPITFHFGVTDEFLPCSLDDRTTALDVSQRPKTNSPLLDPNQLSFECLDGHQHMQSIQQPGCTSAFTCVNKGNNGRENLAETWNDPLSHDTVAGGFLHGQEAVPRSPPFVKLSDRYFHKLNQVEQLSASFNATLDLILEE